MWRAVGSAAMDATDRAQLRSEVAAAMFDARHRRCVDDADCRCGEFFEYVDLAAVALRVLQRKGVLG